MNKQKTKKSKTNTRGQSGRNNVHEELSRVRYEKGTSDKEQKTNKRQKNQKQNIRELYEFIRREL